MFEFDQSSVAPIDLAVRLRRRPSSPFLIHLGIFFQLISVKVTIDVEQNCISVYNNGDGVPMEIHQEEGVYVPEMIFGHLLTSSNYDDLMKKTTGGRNRYGAKLTNIFSTEFVIETADGKRQKKCKLVFSNNMGKKSEPVITKCKDSENWTKRVIDLAGCLGKTVKVELNGQRIPVKSFLDYVNLYLQSASKARSDALPSSDKSPNWHHKALVKFHSIADQTHNGIGNEKELAYLLEEKNMSLAAIQAAHESEINNLGLELDKERDKLANIQLKLQEELKLNKSFQEELNLSKVDKDKNIMPFNCQWILSVLNKAISKTVTSLDSYEFSDAATAVYSWWQFQLCDVFIEAVKPYFASDAQAFASERSYAQDTLSCWANEKVEYEMDMVESAVKSLKSLRALMPAKERHESVMSYVKTLNSCVCSKLVLVTLLWLLECIFRGMRWTAGLEQETESLKKKLTACTREKLNLQEELSEAYRIKGQLADLHVAEVSELEKEVNCLRKPTELAGSSGQQLGGVLQRKRSNDNLFPQNTALVDEQSSDLNQNSIRNVVERGLQASNLYLAKAWFHSSQPMTRSRSSELR
ncbi:unnamed protein product [Camellia sinensis]